MLVQIYLISFLVDSSKVDFISLTRVLVSFASVTCSCSCGIALEINHQKRRLVRVWGK